MKATLLVLLLFIMASHSWGQGTQMPAEYNRLIHEADSLRFVKDYKNASITYSAAFRAYGWKGLADHRYRAARAWAMAGNADSAFFNLERIATRTGYYNYREITMEADFNALHNDARWLPLLTLIKQNRLKEAGHTNVELEDELDSLKQEDQRWRNYMTQHNNKQVVDTISNAAISKYMIRADSLNLKEVRRIFKEYGFPGFDLVGQDGSHDFWLLVQHQDRHPAFQDSVLTAMKVQVDNNKAYGSDYAYLTDRVKVNTGQLQVYGTQMHLNADSTSFEPKPVIDPDKLNERRKSMGLSTIEEYIESMNKTYYGALKKK
jgi:hypothetical protein